MSGREGGAVRDRDQRPAVGRPARANQDLQDRRKPVCSGVREQNEDKGRHAPPEKREREAEAEPDEPESADLSVEPQNLPDSPRQCATRESVLESAQKFRAKY